jgi:hypothetical protein
MHRITRRQFCQFTGLTLATLGLSQLNIQRQGERYGKVLAQSTPRKLALLVGINQYPSPYSLDGCVTDVELQRHLLIYRFGFKPSDIYTLTDEKATRLGILQAFEEHLIKQAQPGDVVVCHYSGHGSRVFDPDTREFGLGADKSGLNGTFVPIDSRLPAGFPETGGVVNDIMGHTLFLLMAALATENVTVVLDSCYSGGATRPEFRFRAREGSDKLQISEAEKSYQQKWLSKLRLSRKEFVNQYRARVAKGVVLAATNPAQTAADVKLNGFAAGAFTYLLTRYLWQQTSTVASAIASVNQAMPPELKQTPSADVKVGSGYEKQPIYFINPTTSTASAVITAVKGKDAALWLGGIDPGIVDEGTVFNLIGSRAGKVTLKSRDGLTGKAIIEGVVKEGTLLQKPEDTSKKTGVTE